MVSLLSSKTLRMCYCYLIFLIGKCQIIEVKLLDPNHSIGRIEIQLCMNLKLILYLLREEALSPLNWITCLYVEA